MSERGTLEKLVILAYTTPNYSGQPIGRFESYVNPNEITLSYEMEYDAAQGAGTTGSDSTVTWTSASFLSRRVGHRHAPPVRVLVAGSGRRVAAECGTKRPRGAGQPSTGRTSAP